jgi:hypothetical protein
MAKKPARPVKKAKSEKPKAKPKAAPQKPAAKKSIQAAPAKGKPAALKEKQDWPRLWQEDISDPQTLFHEAALFLKKHTGYDSLNLAYGGGKKASLLCVHQAGASYLAEEPADKLELFDANTSSKAGSVFVLENDAPARKSWEGPMALVRVPGLEDAYLLLAAGAGAPSYSKADIQDLLSFAPVLAPVFFKYQMQAAVRKQADLALKLKEAERLSKETQDQIRSESAEKLRALETELLNAQADAEAKRKQESLAYEDRVHLLERELHSTKERAGETAKKLTETERFLSERTGLLEREVSSLTTERDRLLTDAEEKARKIEALEEQAESNAAEQKRQLDELLASERSSFQTRLKETETSLTQQIESQRAELTKALEDERTSLTAKLEQERKASEDRIIDLELQLEAAQGDKESALKTAIAREQAVFDARIKELEAQLVQSRSGAGELGKRISEVEADLAKANDEARRLKENLEKTEKERTNTIKDRDLIKDNLSRLEAELNQEKSQAGDLVSGLRRQITELNARIEAEAKRFQSELSFQEARNREVASHLEDEKKRVAEADRKAKEEAARHASELSRLEREVADARTASDRRGKEHNEKVQSLESKIQNQNTELEARNRAIREHKEQIAALEKANLQAKESAQSLQKEIENRDGRISRLGQDLDLAKKEIERLKQEKLEQQKQIKSFEELLLSRDRELKAQSDEIALRDEEIGRLTKETAGLRESKAAADASIAGLQKETAQYREREHRLEQDILGLQEEKRQLLARSESLNEEIRRQKERIEKEIREREAVLAELSSVRAREKKLGEELKSAQAREKGSREEGIILFNFARALTEEESFRGKLDALIRGLSSRIEISRLAVYSVQADDLLALEEVHAGGAYLPLKERIYVPVSKTAMGSAMASLKAVLLPPGEVESPADILRRAGITPGKDSGLVLPLMESKKTIGVMAFYSTEAIPEPDQRLLENLAPLIATSLRQRLEESERTAGSERVNTKDAVIRYLESRLKRSGVEIDPVRKTEEQLASFEVFAHNLAARLKEAGIETELSISPAALLSLAGRIMSPANLHYIALEAVENIEKHSQAGKAGISLQALENGAIELAIEDDGEGLLRTAGSETPRGEGVRAIRSLAADSGAECRMSKGKDGRGLRIECLWRSGPG